MHGKSRAEDIAIAQTNFAALTDEELTVWSLDVWRKARNRSFANRFTGSSQDSMIHRITELTKTKKGARAVITLVNDLDGDGRAGDRTLEGNEEALISEDQVIGLDQLRNANRTKGRMADQRSVVKFREQSRDKLAYWLADRHDQLAFLTLSGVDYKFHTNGAPRIGSDLPLLEYNVDVKPPSPGRYFVWSNGTLDASKTNSDLVKGDLITYAMLVELKAIAKERYIRPISTSNGIEFFNVFLTPQALAQLRLDPDYLQNVRNAKARSEANELFKGTDTIMVDGMAISDFRHVYNTKGLPAGSKWGGAGDVEGSRMLFCGAQALGYADIGNATWEEEKFDYKNQEGISVGKISGCLKPQFEGKEMGGKASGVIEDFGVICVDIALDKAP
jgi:N4-gp56 family major capsid protein